MRFRLLLSLLVLFTLIRVTTTHRVFSQTSDEPWHLAAGYDVLKLGSYTLDTQHPPLARVFFAIPFLDTPPPAEKDPVKRGNELLLRNDRYTQNLGRARLGNLIFLALGILGVALWARHLFGESIALLAALIFASLPPILAHAGVATTDMSGTAMFPLALYALTLLLDEPTWKRAAYLGLAIGAGLLAKYSFLLYFPAAALVLFAMRRRFPFKHLAVATVVAFFVVWGAFRFDVGTLADVDPQRGPELGAEIFHERFAHIPFPAPVYILGGLEVKHHDLWGHKAFLFDEMRIKGWWYYFPVALAVKTPIALLLLALIGCVWRKDVALVAAAVLAIAMTSHINIGVRHVLPIYAPLALLAAYAATRIHRIASYALIGWLVIGSLLAHPDYLPWFNAFAGKEPGKIVNDSNIDWGQDVLRLVRVARKEKIERMTISLFTTADLDRIGLPPYDILQAMQPVHGWLAISEMNLQQGNAYSPEVRKWLDETLGGKPYRRIGGSIRLYDFRSAAAEPPL